mmetsp:Transcript_18198/g.38164  ORF Transcript_18198/g.38164 Transcript_18198/m.38164 type:complete len:113 (-) Transcript_18198:156-494(-)
MPTGNSLTGDAPSGEAPGGDTPKGEAPSGEDATAPAGPPGAFSAGSGAVVPSGGGGGMLVKANTGSRAKLSPSAMGSDMSGRSATMEYGSGGGSGGRLSLSMAGAVEDDAGS